MRHVPSSALVLLLFIVNIVVQIHCEGSVLGFPEQTVTKQGSLVFCASKSSEAECERRSPPERTSVFAGNAQHQCTPQWKARQRASILTCNQRIFFIEKLFLEASIRGRLGLLPINWSVSPARPRLGQP